MLLQWQYEWMHSRTCAASAGTLDKAQCSQTVRLPHPPSLWVLPSSTPQEALGLGKIFFFGSFACHDRFPPFVSFSFFFVNSFIHSFIQRHLWIPRRDKDGKKARISSIIFDCFFALSFISTISCNLHLVLVSNGRAVKLPREVNCISGGAWKISGCRGLNCILQPSSHVEAVTPMWLYLE